MMPRPVRHLPISLDDGDFLLTAEHTGLDPYVLPPPAAANLPPEVQEVTEDGEGLLQVGDIAKASGKTVRAIHHYEQVGLLRPHARSKGRYRLYDHAALVRIRWIGKLHDLGLSLSQIQELVRLWEASPSAPGAMARIRGVYAQKLDETREQIANLKALERELEASIDYLDTCDTCDPGELVRACTRCNHRDRSKPEPHLVAGIHGGNSLHGAAAPAPVSGRDS
jgi:DNA-binding transcriptional MerR regulator